MRVSKHMKHLVSERVRPHPVLRLARAGAGFVAVLAAVGLSVQGGDRPPSNPTNQTQVALIISVVGGPWRIRSNQSESVLDSSASVYRPVLAEEEFRADGSGMLVLLLPGGIQQTNTNRDWRTVPARTVAPGDPATMAYEGLMRLGGARSDVTSRIRSPAAGGRVRAEKVEIRWPTGAFHGPIEMEILDPSGESIWSSQLGDEPVASVGSYRSPTIGEALRDVENLAVAGLKFTLKISDRRATTLATSFELLRASDGAALAKTLGHIDRSDLPKPLQHVARAKVLVGYRLFNEADAEIAAAIESHGGGGGRSLALLRCAAEGCDLIGDGEGAARYRRMVSDFGRTNAAPAMLQPGMATGEPDRRSRSD